MFAFASAGVALAKEQGQGPISFSTENSFESFPYAFIFALIPNIVVGSVFAWAIHILY